MGWNHVGSLCCVHVAHSVCVVLGSSLVFLVFCYVMMGRKIVIVILSQQAPGEAG